MPLTRAVALGVALSAILAYKQSLHDLVDKLGADDIEAGVKLLAATFIVLPLLPREAVDPWGAIEPYSLWLLITGVVIIAGWAAFDVPLGPGAIVEYVLE